MVYNGVSAYDKFYCTVTPEWGCSPFWRDSIVCKESCIASVIAALALMFGVNGPLGVEK